LSRRRSASPLLRTSTSSTMPAIARCEPLDHTNHPYDPTNSTNPTKATNPANLTLLTLLILLILLSLLSLLTLLILLTLLRLCGPTVVSSLLRTSGMARRSATHTRSATTPFRSMGPTSRTRGEWPHLMHEISFRTLII
jgi:hypothetical protein